MKQKTSHRPFARHAKRAFTLIELLTVIAIIAILAALIFPVFGAVRENARQSNTMSSLYSTYVATKLYYEDEGKFPTTLFGYAEVADNNLNPPARPLLESDSRGSAIPFRSITGTYRIKSGTSTSLHRGYLYRDQIKDATTFINSNNLIRDEKAITPAYYPINSPRGGGAISNGVLSGGTQVTWEDFATTSDGCKHYGDAEIPVGGAYVGMNKLFYTMDSLDIGPMIGPDGKAVTDGGGNTVYELHYSPDWTDDWGSTCDVDTAGNPYTHQLKYKNPPTDHTIITYVTQHAATGNGKVLVLLLTGTVRKMSSDEANIKLPLNY